MLRVRRILFPTDFSTTADAALSTAAQWAVKLAAELHIFHGLEILRPDFYPPSRAAAESGDPYREVEYTMHRELERRRRMVADQGASAVCASAKGLAAPNMILDYAQDNAIDLVILSTHGRRGVRHLLLGSVAEEIVQRAKCPVLTVSGAHPHDRTPSPQRILVAVDLSDHSAAPVAHAKHLAALFGSELELLHVIVRHPLPPYYDGMAIPTVLPDSQVLEREAANALLRLYDGVGGPGGPFRIRVAQGVATEQIVSAAEVHGCDLIVLATHGLTGFSHLMLGSVAERVVRQAACPVLTVKNLGRWLIEEVEDHRFVPGRLANRKKGERPCAS